MRLRNGPAGYGAVTKTLHWLTVRYEIVDDDVALAGHVGGHVLFYAAVPRML